jgi:hypothetical protein
MVPATVTRSSLSSALASQFTVSKSEVEVVSYDEAATTDYLSDNFACLIKSGK